MQESDIAWTDYTWNPTHGCSRASAGCDNCYAETISLKWGHTEKPWTNEHADENVQLRHDKLEEPYTLTGRSPDAWAPNLLETDAHPPRVFVNSMSDLFHSAIPAEYIRDVFAVMRNCPHVVFQILTKRPGRAAHMEIEWPANVWIGTSVEDERVAPRIDMLRNVDAHTRFISFEPLIGSVGDVDLTGIDWAIVGGESGPDDVRRDMDHEWARKILEFARRDDVAYFFKQSSARYPERNPYLTVPKGGFDAQRMIREYPDVATMVSRATDAMQEGSA